MIHFIKWGLGHRLALAALLSLSALAGYAQCVTPTTPINFSTSGNNTASGFVTTYVLTDNSGNIVQSVSSGFAAPNQNGTFKVYTINYDNNSGATAPTLTAGTNVTAIGGSCVSLSSSPITFCVTAPCITGGSSISFAASGQNATADYQTRYVLTNSAGSILSNTPSSPIVAPTTAGSYQIYVVNYNTAGGATAPTLTAGTNVTAIGGSCVAASSSPLLFDVCAPVPDLTPIIYALPSTLHNTTNITYVVDVVELKGVNSSGVITVKVTKDALTSLTFVSGATSVGGKSVQNSVWSFDNTDDDVYIFTTSASVVGGNKLSFGLSGVMNPGASTGTLTVSVVIVGGSGGEVRTTNNVDADKIDYFQQ